MAKPLAPALMPALSLPLADWNTHSLSTGGGVVVPFPAFAYEAEADTLAASFSSAPTTRRKRTINRAIKRLKAAGIWSLATAINFRAAADEDAALKNWKTPGTYNATKVGAPTFTANRGYVSAANTQYLNTNLPANVLQQNDLGVYVFVDGVAATSSNLELGAANASSQGVGIAARRVTDENMTLRLASVSSVAVSDPGDSDGSGLSGGSRSDASNMTGSRNGVTKNTVAVASAALPAVNIYELVNNANGTPGNPTGRRIAFTYYGRALTAAQERELHAIVSEYCTAVRFGEPIVEQVGTETQTINAQCVAYGFTMQSVLYCLQAARNGRTVALVGGWRDRWNFGGMSSGGLGWTDFDNHASLGGLPRYIIKRMQAIDSKPTEDFYFEPRRFQAVMRELLDPTKNGGYSIPVYQTDGVVSVQKTGTTITSITTQDGRTVSALQWFDGGYEGDLMRAAGCSYFIGREAAGTGAEALNGVDSNTTFTEYAGVDPWLTPGVPASGPIRMINASRSTFSPGYNDLPPAGSADSVTQAYNFRLTMSNVAKFRVPLPSTPPSGYDVADYEIVLRFMAANPSLNSFLDYFKADQFATDKYDVNNRAGPAAPSTDYIGKNWDYPLGARAVREAIWKANWNWAMGLIYLMQYGTDPRIPAGLQTSARAWGFASDHYFAPHENDTVFMNPQLYVRESIRLNGVAKMDGNELKRGDGGVPTISTNTISTISYMMDSHATRYIAFEKTAGNWMVAAEGGLADSMGGTDDTLPVPIEIVLPKATECTNLSVGFCVSSTHVAFGAIRMEYTAGQIGQSMGQAAHQAIADGSTIQAVNYSAVRTALLANAFALTNEPAPVLPQTT